MIFWAQYFRSDLSISMEELGSLLDHTGPQRDAENYIAEVFEKFSFINCHKWNINRQ